MRKMSGRGNKAERAEMASQLLFGGMRIRFLRLRILGVGLLKKRGGGRNNKEGNGGKGGPIARFVDFWHS